MLNKKYFRVHKSNGTIFEFTSINEEIYSVDSEGQKSVDGSELIEDSAHSYWVGYVEHYDQYEEDGVQKARWNFSINDVNYGDLESLKIGSIYRPLIPRLLPNVDFGTTNPDYYVFDFELNEWKSPLFDLDGIKIWNTDKKEYVPLPSQ